MSCRSVYRSRHARVNLLQCRYHLQTILVACGVSLKISAVGDKTLTSFIYISFDILSRHIEQRSYHTSVHWSYSRQSLQSRATHKVHQHRFHVVVTVMRHNDGLSPNILSQSFEIAVSQVACSSLYAQLMQRSISTSVEMHAVQRHAKPLTQTSHKRLVAVGLLATQMEVAVNGLHAVSLVEHHHQ